MTLRIYDEITFILRIQFYDKRLIDEVLMAVDREGEPRGRRGDAERRVSVAWRTTQQHQVSDRNLH